MTVEGLDEVTIVTEPSEEFLSDRQVADYRSGREACIRWLLAFGKNPRRFPRRVMKEAGVSLQYRQLVANHQDPSTTQRYSHGQEEEFAAIRDQFDPPR